MLRRCTLIALVCLLSTVSWSAPASGTGGMLRDATVSRRVGTGFEIAFTLAGPTDVTVRIVDAKGRVVRHLASGMVGRERAASPLAPKTLSQKIPWDGKDDAGNPVDAAGCKATIGTGMTAKFDRFILGEKDACARSRPNLYYPAPTRGGETYVIQMSGVHLDTLRVFDAEGKFVREVWPPNLNRSAEAVERLLGGRWGAADWDGDRVPFKVCMNSWYIFGTRSGSITVTTDGYVVGLFAGVGGGGYAIDPDGFPHAWRWRAPWYVRQQTYKTKSRIAAGTDGDFYLTDNYHHVVGRFRAKDMTPVDSFTHNGGTKLDPPRCYLGEMGKAGDNAGHFTGPDDVALDDEGNLCVLDGDEVKVYDAAGRFVRKAGKDAFPAASPVPKAVSDTEKAPRALVFPHFLKVRADGTLFIMHEGRDVRVIESDVDGKTFKPFKQPWACNPYHGYSDFDAQGNWYVAMGVYKKPQQVWKYAPDDTRAKFADRDAISLGEENDPFRLNKGLCVATTGDVYVVTQTNKWSTKPPAQTGGAVFGDLSARGAEVSQTRVDVYGPDGTLKTKGIVRSVGINDVAVDREGNIYVIDGTMWHGAQMAGVAVGRAAYGKKHWPFPYLTPEQAALDPKTQANKRYSLLSRLVKFSPEGGILDDTEGRGQLWSYAGVSGVSPWNCDAECPAAQICLDPDERLWVPDSFLYCVKAVDRAGNEMLRVGKYGNEDCRGGGGDRRHPQLKDVVIDPEVPLSYPKGIAVHDDDLLISDMYAHRVLRCRLEYTDRREIALAP